MNKFVEQFEKYEFPLLGYIKIPKFSIPDTDITRLNLNKNSSSKDYLVALAKEGFSNKLESGWISKDRSDEYKERLKHEIKEIVRLQFVDYILLVKHIIDFCKENKILNGPARGSCGGSLLLAVLDCIKIDPIKHKLIFERFIASERTEIKEIDGEIYIKSESLPDVDIDSQHNLKHLINKYLEKQFPNKTVAICNISTFQTKVVLKEVYKCYEGASEEDAKIVSNYIESMYGKNETIEKALEENIEFKKWANNHSDTIKIAQSIYKLIKNKSVHASGILLCNNEISDCIPLELDSDKKPVTGYTMNDAQMFGIKLDNLGVKGLNIINDCLNKVNLKMEDIDVNHPSIYEFLNNSDCYYGIFQASEGLGKRVMQKLNCQNVDDLSLSIATGRPGSLSFFSKIVEAKNGGKLKDWGDERVNNILKDTYNVIVYQETIMRICREMAGFNGLETNSIRKIIGKKLVDQMPEWKEKFINQSVANGYSLKVCEELWKTFESSGNYLFNASHSCGYAYISAICCFLKVNYPLEFFWACLRNAQYEQKPLDEIQNIQSELSHFNIKLLPPHIIKSGEDFEIENNNVRMPISSIKGFAAKTLPKLTDFRHEYSNKFEIFHAAKECSLSISVLVSLIGAGCLSDHIDNRAKVMLEAQIWNLLKEKEHQKSLEYGPKFDFDLIETLKFLNKELKDDKGKPIIKDSRYATIKKHAAPFINAYKENKKNENLLKYWLEWKNLGFSYSTNLFDIYKKECPDLIPIQGAIEEPEESFVQLVGHTAEAKQGKSKAKKTPYLKLVLKDAGFQITCLAFNTEKFQAIDEIKYQNERLPKEEDIVIVQGKRKGDAVFVKNLSIQEIKIFDKPAKIK